MTQQPEVRKFTAPCVEKAQVEGGWRVKFTIPELSQYAYSVNRIPDADAAKLEPGKSYYISLIKGRLKDASKDASKDYNYWWDWGGMAVEVLPENAPPVGAVSMMATPAPPIPDARADSIERQVALKVGGELYVGAMAAMADTEATVAEALALARRLVAYFFGDKS